MSEDEDIVDALLNYDGYGISPCKQAADEIERLRDDNNRLRNALKPFARLADNYDKNDGKATLMFGAFTINDLRKARALVRKG